MYLGLMKKGVSIMAMFFMAIGSIAFLGLDVMAFTLPVIWFYSFFDALNYNNMPYEKKVLIEDQFLMDFDTLTKISSSKNNIVLGAFLMILGVYIIFHKMIQPMLWELQEYSPVLHRLLDNLPTLFIAFGIVILGLRLINGRKAEIEDLREDYKEFKGNNK